MSAAVQGVVTTGIYCRPSCSARPKPENVRRFESVEAARAAGFRACKRCHPDAAAPGALVLRLPWTEPFDARSLLAFFAARAVPGVEEVLDDGGLRRSLRMRHGAAVVELRPGDGELAGWLWLDDRRDRNAALRRVGGLFDIDADGAAIAEALRADELIAPLVASAPGRRVPGAADGAEIAVRAVLGQQISVAGARALAGRLVAAHGEPLRNPVGGVTHLFPSTDALADADPSAWPMPASRKRALGALAGALAGDPALLSDRERLLALPGIGPWTVDYIAMRALRDPDVFMPTDLGVKRALVRLGVDPQPSAAERLSERWRPFRSYALQHLWGIA